MALFKKHKTEPVPPEDTGAHDTSVGTAADVEAVMKKYDRESNTRVWEGLPKLVIRWLMVAFSAYCIIDTVFLSTRQEVRLPMFVGLILLFGFLTFPAKKGDERVNHMPWYDIVLLIAGPGAYFFYAVNAQNVVQMSARVMQNDLYMIIGLIGILALVELCRRCVGLPILCVAGVLLVYTFFNLGGSADFKMTLYQVIRTMFYTTNGIFSGVTDSVQSMSIYSTVLLVVMLILVVAALTTLLCKKINLPSVLGYILAGFLAGPVVQFLPTIEDLGSIWRTRGKHAIHCLTVVGQVEGHVEAPQGQKTTKYEHVIPQLVAVQEDPGIEGLLVLLNTVGGDVEAGLALAELIASISKPSAAVVLGGGHSIGIPLAVSARRSFIVPTATMTIHPVRHSGMILGVPQTMRWFEQMQERITGFVAAHSGMTEKRYTELMLRTGELVMDVGTVLDGRKAVREKLIDQLGGISDALEWLYQEIEKG